MSDTPAIHVDRQPNAVVVKLAVKDLDEVHISQMRNEMDPAIADSPGKPFIIDMNTVKFVPSLTLGVLVRMSTEFRNRKQRLILVALTPMVRQVFAITRLDKIFEIMDSSEAALKNIGESGN